jgi:hypothetical protein
MVVVMALRSFSLRFVLRLFEQEPVQLEISMQLHLNLLLEQGPLI